MTPDPRFPCVHPFACAAAGITLAAWASTAHVASNSWIPGNVGDYTDPLNWTGGVDVPNGAADVATIEGTGSIVDFVRR